MINSHISSPMGLKESLLKTANANAHLNALIADNQSDAAQEQMYIVDSGESAAVATLLKTKQLQRPEAKGKTKEIERTEKGFLIRKDLDNLADGFSKREENFKYRLPAKSLSRLAGSLGTVITPDTDPEELITLIRNELKEGAKNPDVVQVDKAFDFLLEVTQAHLETAEGPEADYLDTLYESLTNAKLRHYERFKVDIDTAHSIIGAADALVTEKRSTAESLDHLREMVNNPQDAHTKYEYYMKKGYDSKMMVAEFKLLFNYTGGLVKTRLENPHLRQLLEEIRVLQSVLGVLKQSKREFSSMFVYLDGVRGLFNE